MMASILILLLSISAFAQIPDTIRDRKSEYANLKRSKFALLPHRPSYFMPYVYNWMPHENIYDKTKAIDSHNSNDEFYKKNEAEFQFSFAVPVVRKVNDRQWDIMVAYTHHAWWQVYNSEWSRPFRETNYSPELFSRYIYNHPKKFFGTEIVALDLGYIHQSNGQIQLLSRSWNRLYARSLIQVERFNIILSAWYRVPEKKSEDDNRHITRYMGAGEIEIMRDIGKHKVHLKMPLFPSYQSYDIRYSYPLTEGIRWYGIYQSGYGHSLIEYNRQTQRFGIGFVLENFIY